MQGWWERILEQCADMRPCNTTSSIASSTYRRLVHRLRPHNCEAHLMPLVGVIFVKWECSCTWIVLQASIWQAVLRKSAQLTASNAYLFGRSVANSPHPSPKIWSRGWGKAFCKYVVVGDKGCDGKSSMEIIRKYRFLYKVYNSS